MNRLVNAPVVAESVMWRGRRPKL